MGNFGKHFSDGNFHAQLLADFADETLLERLARFTFAAGKFPKSAKVRFCVALRYQQFALVKNQRGGNLDDVIRAP